MNMLLVFVFGTCLSSFALCLAERMIAKEDFVFAFSHCNSCKRILKPYELVPVFSYLLSKGKCPVCGYQIPAYYPIIELLAGIVFLLLYQSKDRLSFMFLAFATFVLLILSYIDYKTYLLPDCLLVVLALAGLLYLSAFYADMRRGIIESSAIFLCLVLLSFVMKRIYHQEMIGDGDLKLIGILSLYLNLQGLMVMMLLACLVALGAFAILKKDMLPFGPIIAFSFILVMLVA